MTKAEIIAELRRSAAEDESCYDLSYTGFQSALAYRSNVKRNEILGDASDWHWRTFYLLVACALEGE